MQVYELRSPWGAQAWKRVERAEPMPGPGQVVVRVRAASLNYRDLMIAKATYGKPQENRIPLSDGAGEVARVGEGVTKWKAGDRVAGCFFQGWASGPPSEHDGKTALGGPIDGMLAQEVVLSQEGIVRLPSHMTFEEGATLPCAALTAWHALVTLGQLAPGETVLCLGTGGVSVFALQIARMTGARVAITSSSDAKLARARELGATWTVNYKTTPEWGEAVKKLVGERGVDHVVEVGGAGTMPHSLKACRTGGRISLIGILGGAGDMNPRPIFQKSITFQGIYVGSRDMFEAMNRALEAGGVRPAIDRVFPFADAPRALEHLESGTHFGKVVVQV